jgi:pimeloyl-ACP methyl ester carboxylesterase
MMAQDIHALAVKLGYNRSIVVGHDIGLIVAYAYAAQYPTEVDRIARPIRRSILMGKASRTTPELLKG